MAKYLYIFGYRTPAQIAAAAAAAGAGAGVAPTSPDDESSEALFIEADSPDAALSWGREISEAFVQSLFAGPAQAQAQSQSWKAMGFTHWLETDPGLEYPADTLARLPVVVLGHYPDFSLWLSRARAKQA